MCGYFPITFTYINRILLFAEMYNHRKGKMAPHLHSFISLKMETVKLYTHPDDKIFINKNCKIIFTADCAVRACAYICILYCVYSNTLCYTLCYEYWFCYTVDTHSRNGDYY